MSEYVATRDFDLSAVGEHLDGRLHAGAEEARTVDSTFYDTFDRRLDSRELVLVHEDGFLRLRTSDGAELAAQAAESAPQTLAPAELAPGPLRERLEPACGLRVLLQAGTLRARRRVLPVLDDEEKTVARVVVDEATLAGASQARVTLAGVRGYDKALDYTKRVIERDLGLEPARRTLAREVRMTATVTEPAPVVDLAPQMAGERAAAALCLRQLHVIETNLPGTLADLDTEFLHDLRVAVRRTRSLQRELKRVFPPEELAFHRAEFRWLQQVTGPTRDLDVYLLDFGGFAAEVPEEQRADLDLLRMLLAEQRADERAEMDDALRSERAQRVLQGWRELLERLPDEPAEERPAAHTPIRALAAHRIARVYKQMVRMGTAIDDDSPGEALHELRKKGKELRYLLEFFAPLFPARVTKPMVKTLKALQDTLGRHQDREVQAAMIRGLGDQLARRPGGAQSLMAMGVLVERLEQHQRDARAEFHERFAAFASRKQRKLVKETFRA